MDWEHVSFCKTPEMHIWIIKGIFLAIAIILGVIGAWLLYPYTQVPGIAHLNLWW